MKSGIIKTKDDRNIKIYRKMNKIAGEEGITSNIAEIITSFSFYKYITNELL